MKAPDFLGMLRGFAGRNLGLKFLALGLSVVAWWFVAGETKVLVGMIVPLEIRELPKGMTVGNKVERQVEVRLSGPSSLLSALKASDISVGVDLSNGKPGRQTVALDDRSVKAPPGIKVQRIFPSSIEVILERTERRVVPVSARIGGGAAVRRRVLNVEVDPPSVEIEALPEEFSRMAVVYTEEVVPERTEGAWSAIARVETREAHAKIVGNPDVRVRIRFRR